MPASITARGRRQFWHALSGLGDGNDAPLLSQAVGLGCGRPSLWGFGNVADPPEQGPAPARVQPFAWRFRGGSRRTLHLSGGLHGQVARTRVVAHLLSTSALVSTCGE